MILSGRSMFKPMPPIIDAESIDDEADEVTRKIQADLNQMLAELKGCVKDNKTANINLNSPQEKDQMSCFIPIPTIVPFKDRMNYNKPNFFGWHKRSLSNKNAGSCAVTSSWTNALNQASLDDEKFNYIWNQTGWKIPLSTTKLESSSPQQSSCKTSTLLSSPPPQSKWSNCTVQPSSPPQVNWNPFTQLPWSPQSFWKKSTVQTSSPLQKSWNKSAQQPSSPSQKNGTPKSHCTFMPLSPPRMNWNSLSQPTFSPQSNWKKSSVQPSSPRSNWNRSTLPIQSYWGSPCTLKWSTPPPSYQSNEKVQARTTRLFSSTSSTRSESPIKVKDRTPLYERISSAEYLFKAIRDESKIETKSSFSDIDLDIVMDIVTASSDEIEEIMETFCQPSFEYSTA